MLRKTLAAILAVSFASPLHAGESLADQAVRKAAALQAAAATPEKEESHTLRNVGLGLLGAGALLGIVGATKGDSAECNSTDDFGVRCDTSSGSGMIVAGILAAGVGVAALVVDSRRTSVTFVPGGVAVGYRLRF